MRGFLFVTLAFMLAACGGPVLRPAPETETIAQSHDQERKGVPGRGNDIVLYALALLDTGYRFGGKNPEAGLDCSGMVSYVFDRAAGLRVSGSAADIARLGRAVGRSQLQPGDLVFFNTLGRPFSHVGIYIGDGRFVHAPRTNGKVRIDRLTDRYYTQRFEAARTYFE